MERRPPVRVQCIYLCLGPQERRTRRSPGDLRDYVQRCATMPLTRPLTLTIRIVVHQQRLELLCRAGRWHTRGGTLKYALTQPPAGGGLLLRGFQSIQAVRHMVGVRSTIVYTVVVISPAAIESCVLVCCGWARHSASATTVLQCDASSGVVRSRILVARR